VPGPSSPAPSGRRGEEGSVICGFVPEQTIATSAQDVSDTARILMFRDEPQPLPEPRAYPALRSAPRVVAVFGDIR